MTERIDAALDAVDDERTVVRAEYQALGAFDRRVAELPTATVSTGPALVVDPRPSGPSLERVKTAYAETVMSVPHYESAYGDTLAESLAAEFGDDIAGALIGGSRLTPEFRDALRAATEAARREREEFLDVLEREADSLAALAGDVATVETAVDAATDCPLSDRSFDDLHDRWTSVRDLEARVEGIALRRQETIRGQRTALPGVPADLTEYLYADLSASYPALASLADLADRLERARREVERALVSAA